MSETKNHEQAVLGALLLDSTAFDEVGLSSADFVEGTHRKVFTSIESLINQGKPIDLITISDELKKGNGGMSDAYLASLTSAVPTSANVGYYADLVREASLKRQLTHLGLMMKD